MGPPDPNYPVKIPRQNLLRSKSHLVLQVKILLSQSQSYVYDLELSQAGTTVVTSRMGKRVTWEPSWELPMKQESPDYWEIGSVNLHTQHIVSLHFSLQPVKTVKTILSSRAIKKNLF